MGALALVGGTVVLVAALAALVVIAVKAIGRARPEDVPYVMEQVMGVLRDSRRTVRRRLGRSPNRAEDLEGEEAISDEGAAA